VKLLRVGPAGQERPAVSQDGVLGYDLSGLLPGNPDALLSPAGQEIARAVIERPGGTPRIDLPTVRLGPPVQAPGKIVCVGLNYRAHAAEAGMAEPVEPVLFMKAPYTVQGPTDEVVIPLRSEKTDYEVELAVVIGTAARYLASPDAALAHVLGYTISHDVSERAFQLERGGQWDKGKNCETFNPLGPWISTTDEIGDPQQLRLTLHVNGQPRQDSSTADMIFDVAHLVWYISQFMALLPGDIVNTGTPQGVGSGFTPPVFLRAGDVVELAISGLGSQRQRLRDYDPAAVPA
jgi:2-keto-4-pentenoate hydratase/2-oxohepta-3-ene-1,7-dioic acid hydratase in catechol pathway